MNRFKNHVMRKEYEVASYCWRIKHRDLFRNGEPYRHGSSFANFFWAGYDGRIPSGCGRGFTDRASREMIGYAWYRAGQDCAGEAQKASKTAPSAPQAGIPAHTPTPGTRDAPKGPKTAPKGTGIPGLAVPLASQAGEAPRAANGPKKGPNMGTAGRFATQADRDDFDCRR